MKKIISTILALCMVFCIFSVSNVSAYADSSTSGVKYFPLDSHEFIDAYNRSEHALGTLKKESNSMDIAGTDLTIIFFATDTSNPPSGATFSVPKTDFNEIMVRLQAYGQSKRDANYLAAITMIGQSFAEIFDPTFDVNDFADNCSTSFDGNNATMTYSHNGFDYKLECFSLPLWSSSYYYDFYITLSEDSAISVPNNTANNPYGTELEFFAQYDSGYENYNFKQFFAKAVPEGVQLTVLFDIPRSGGYSFFSPPNGDAFMKTGQVSASDTMLQITFSEAELKASENMSVKFYATGTGNNAAWLFIDGQDYKNLFKVINGEDVFSHTVSTDADYDSNYGTEIDFDTWTDSGYENYHFEKFYAKPVSGGLQITVLFDIPRAGGMSIFNPPTGDNFMVVKQIAASDTMVSIKLSEEELKSSDWLTLKMWANNEAANGSAGLSVGGLSYSKLLDLLEK